MTDRWLAFRKCSLLQFFFTYLQPCSYTFTFILNSILGEGSFSMSISNSFMALISLFWFSICLEKLLRLFFKKMIQVSMVLIVLCHNSKADIIYVTVLKLLFAFLFLNHFPLQSLFSHLKPM